MDITVPEEFVRELLVAYASASQATYRNSDVSYNLPENAIRRLCKANGVKKKLEDWAATIVSHK